MCAEYTLKGKRKDLEEILEKAVPHIPKQEWDLHAKLFSKAPVILMNENHELEVEEMSFSLKPPSTSYPTFNARLSSWDEKKQRIVKVSEKPTWKKPIENYRCVVPMTGFIEPIYLGEHAGHAIEFHSAQDRILFAVGIYEESINEKTGEPYKGFSLILHTPSEFILHMGHHRQVVLLSPKDALRWIVPGLKKADSAYKFLLEHRYLPDLESQEVRPLSKNWEKKIPEYREKLHREQEYMKKLTAVSP